jgi:probable DNA metabolism protein
MELRYDGSLNGFFCLVGQAIKERLEVEKISRKQTASTANLFATEREIVYDQRWAEKVASGLEERLGRSYMLTFAQAFFSEEEGVELDLLQLTRQALHRGPNVLRQLVDPLVNRIDSAALRTARERHRLLGLLRFTHLSDDSYLARIIPRTNVVPLLGGHFAKRLGDQRWLIVDDKRRLGVIGEGRSWQLLEEVEISAAATDHPDEEQVVSMWRGFYQHISNPDRYNPKLRQQFMPKHYWRYLTELQNG